MSTQVMTVNLQEKSRFQPHMMPVEQCKRQMFHAEVPALEQDCKVKCKYGVKCRIQDCPAFHPRGRRIDAVTGAFAEGDPAQLSAQQNLMGKGEGCALKCQYLMKDLYVGQRVVAIRQVKFQGVTAVIPGFTGKIVEINGIAGSVEVGFNARLDGRQASMLLMPYEIQPEGAEVYVADEHQALFHI